MNAMAVQWTALVLCGVGAAIRVPGLRKGQGRTVFAALVLLTAAVGLSLPPIYHAVDGVLGGVNVANLLLRFILYAVFMLLGIRMAVAFGSKLSHRLIIGPIGIVVLAMTVIATVYFFAASELPTSAPGLRAFGDQDTVQQYATVGRLYPGYVSACLLLPVMGSVLDRNARIMHRIAGAFVAGGLALVVVFVVLRLTPVDLRQWDVVLPFSAIMLTVVGLCLIRCSHVLGERKGRRVNLLS